MKQVHEIIIRPVITEHSMKEASEGRYTFMVDPGATKTEIKNAIENLFNVNVKKVMTNITKGTKTKLTRKRKIESKIHYKKARVNLSKDQKIDIFDEHIEG